MSKVPVFEYSAHVSEISLRLPGGGEKTIRINPGWSFGKGQHPTTRLCIGGLENLFNDKEHGYGPIETVLDVGCGSGVLAICAAALGAVNAIGVDIDNIIVLEARANVRDNGFSSRAEIILGSIEDIHGSFDLVVANMLIGGILAITGQLKKKVKPGGLLLLSGIKGEEKGQVAERLLELGFSPEHESRENDWVSFLFRNQSSRT